MKSFVAAICLSVPITVFAGAYDDCILSGMKGVSGDSGAALVAKACQNKVKEGQRQKRSAFGADLETKDYSLEGGGDFVKAHADGFWSQVFVNRSQHKTVTYVALKILDGDYYDFKPAEAESGGNAVRQQGTSKRKLDDPFVGVINAMGESYWQEKRTHVYHYKLALKPGKSVRLKFPEPKTETFYSSATVVLGRESKWGDATQQFKDEVLPEASDPLE